MIPRDWASVVYGQQALFKAFVGKAPHGQSILHKDVTLVNLTTRTDEPDPNIVKQVVEAGANAVIVFLNSSGITE